MFGIEKKSVRNGLVAFEAVLVAYTIGIRLLAAAYGITPATDLTSFFDFCIAVVGVAVVLAHIAATREER